MVQVEKMNEYDEVKGCQMHDLLRDLSIRKAKEEIDFEVVREEHNSSHQSLAKPRHRSIYCSGRRFFYSTNRNKHLRSLFVHYTLDWQLISGGPSSYWKSFELLRVLDFGRTEFKVLPKGIGELIGLRYLRMRVYGRGSRLPHSWAKLKNLEVLHITGEKGLFGRFGGIIIDKVILNMESLRHLYVHVYMLLKEDPMPILEKLPKLIYLKLISYNEVGGIMVIARGGFPTLKVLHLRYFAYALKMEIEESAMPELNQFIINKGPDFDVANLPERIKSTIVRAYY